MFDHSRTRSPSPGPLTGHDLCALDAPGSLGGQDSHCWLMRRDLARPLPPTVWPEGLRLKAFSAADAPGIHRLLCLGYQHGGGSVADYATWLNALEHDPEFDPALCYTAWDASGLVGVIQGWTSAFIKDLVVHPRARRHGTGLALLNQALALFRQRGEGQVDLKVMENNIGARRLYEKAGMRYVQRSTTDQV
jgi:ribosomal protein S18 acetylase RimI-like enzyme